jgi:hypothetical protein
VRASHGERRQRRRPTRPRTRRRRRATPKGPTVSRIAPVASPIHGRERAHATPPTTQRGGRPRRSKTRATWPSAPDQGASAAHGASASGKPKPVVSGAAALRRRQRITAPGGHAAEPPAAAKAPAKAADATRRPTPRRRSRRAARRGPPSRHRLGARRRNRQAGHRARTPHRGTRDIRAGAAHGPGQRSCPAPGRQQRPAPARVALTWPAPRWQVAWPSPGRIALRWPEVVADAPTASAVPPRPD